jgi:hypothetical protein
MLNGCMFYFLSFVLIASQPHSKGVETVTPLHIGMYYDSRVLIPSWSIHLSCVHSFLNHVCISVPTRMYIKRWPDKTPAFGKQQKDDGMWTPQLYHVTRNLSCSCVHDACALETHGRSIGTCFLSQVGAYYCSSRASFSARCPNLRRFMISLNTCFNASSCRWTIYHILLLRIPKLSTWCRFAFGSDRPLKF